MKLHNILNLEQKKWVDINNDARIRYNTNSQVKSKTAMLKSSLWDYSNVMHTYL